MDDMQHDPLERQVADVARRVVGPTRHVEALAIARHAAAPRRRWQASWLAGPLKFAAGGLVVALFGGLLLMSGVLEVGRDGSGEPGASPSPSQEAPSPTAPELGPATVTHSTGSFEELFANYNSKDVPGSSATLAGPRWFTVTSSDARLEGEATMLAMTEGWAPDAEGRVVDVTEGRLQIEGDDGRWTGTVGPWVNRLTLDLEAESPDADAIPEEAAGPILLTGSGAYEGLTAYLMFPAPDPSDGETSIWFSVVGTTERPFDAVVVDRPPPGVPTDDQWTEELRRTGQLE